MSKLQVTNHVEPSKPLPICPDVRQVDLPELRRQAYRAYRMRPSLLPWERPWIILLFINAALMPLTIRWIDSINLPMARGVALGCLFVVGPSLSYYLLARRNRERFVRQYLHNRGVPICTQCGYDIRGLTTPRCPECGHAFDPSLFADFIVFDT